MHDVMNHPLVKKAERAAYDVFSKRICSITTPAGTVERPYFIHLWETALMLAEAGMPEQAVAAGFLHAHPKHLMHWNEDLIEREFDRRVASLVTWVVEGSDHLPERLRIDFLLSRLQNAPVAALAIVCASKISNFRSISGVTPEVVSTGALARLGWSPMRGTFSESMFLYDRLAPIFHRKVSTKLVHSFFEGKEHFESLGAYLPRRSRILTAA